MPQKAGVFYTSMEMDGDLFDTAWAYSGIKKKKAFFDDLLRTYVRLHQQAGVKKLRGKLIWKGDLAELRE